ncbi:hypothetical protein ERJ75_000698000 [Trypanosoma vivax]|nr:hypothetical protein ERJ75_000698000 [Trypanosoma vivax]
MGQLRRRCGVVSAGNWPGVALPLACAPCRPSLRSRVAVCPRRAARRSPTGTASRTGLVKASHGTSGRVRAAGTVVWRSATTQCDAGCPTRVAPADTQGQKGRRPARQSVAAGRAAGPTEQCEDALVRAACAAAGEGKSRARARGRRAAARRTRLWEKAKRQRKDRPGEQRCCENGRIAAGRGRGALQGCGARVGTASGGNKGNTEGKAREEMRAGLLACVAALVLVSAAKAQGAIIEKSGVRDTDAATLCSLSQTLKQLHDRRGARWRKHRRGRRGSRRRARTQRGRKHTWQRLERERDRALDAHRNAAV